MPGSILVLEEVDGADWVSGGRGQLFEPAKWEELDSGLSQETTEVAQA